MNEKDDKQTVKPASDKDGYVPAVAPDKMQDLPSHGDPKPDAPKKPVLVKVTLPDHASSSATEAKNPVSTSGNPEPYKTEKHHTTAKPPDHASPPADKL